MDLLKFRSNRNIQLTGLLIWFGIPFFFPLFDGDTHVQYYREGLNWRFWHKDGIAENLIGVSHVIIPISIIITSIIIVFKISKRMLILFVLTILDMAVIFLATQIVWGFGFVLYGTYFLAGNIILINIILLNRLFQNIQLPDYS